MRGDPPRSILVIQTAFIGDVVLVTSLLKSIQRAYPEAHIDIMVRPPSDNLVETLPFIDQVLVYDKHGLDRGFGGFIRQAKRLRQRRYDLVLSPHRSLRSGLLAWCSRAATTIGFWRGGGRLCYTHKVGYPADSHEIERNLRLLGAVAGDVPPENPDVPATADDIEQVDALLQGINSRDIIALAPGSVWFTKRWPVEYWQELARKLLDDFNIVLIGGAEDTSLGEQILKACDKSPLSLMGKVTLRQSVEALRRSQLLVTNDSAPTHLGFAAGTRVLTIFGSTIPGFGFAPYGPRGRVLGIDIDCRPCTDHGRQKCPEEHLRCLKDITPDRVYQTVQQMLQEIPDE